MKTLRKALYLIRKALCILGAGILCLILVLLLLFVVSPLINDRSAAGIARRLRELPLPENTEYIDSVSAAGKLVGNGNGMQFFGAVLIKSGLTLAELDRYYGRLRKTEWECIVEAQPGREVAQSEHRDLSFCADLDQDERYYIVYTWGNGVFPFSDFDLRGN